MKRQPAITFDKNDWAGTDSPVVKCVVEYSEQCLAAYRVNPHLVVEHANIERAITQGGYERRQIYELVQNAADAMIDGPPGRIEVVLSDTALYCANEGNPVTAEGAGTLLSSHVSIKRGSEIGRFGLGFKSVLEVTDSPEFYSRSGSFRFHAWSSASFIQEIVPSAKRTPALRLAWPLEAVKESRYDSVLFQMMSWASTVVKLPLGKTEGPQPVGEIKAWISEEMKAFPAEFLLFSPHVATLSLEDRAYGSRRDIQLSRSADTICLEVGPDVSEWKVFSTQHKPSPEARKEAGELADRESLPLMWAVRIKGRSASERGVFWAFFPTEYYTTLSGIVNAPWKANEDRQNLLTGKFNEELISAAADLIVECLPFLLEPDDPAQFLDLLPGRGKEAPNWADKALTDAVYKTAAQKPSLPDQIVKLQCPGALNIHPSTVPRAALDAWASYEGRPRNWCHPSVETTVRRSRAERLIAAGGGAQRSLPDWLEAVTADWTAAGSLAALRAAAAVLLEKPDDLGIRRLIESANILLTADGRIVPPVPGTVFLPGDIDIPETDLPLVHPAILACEEGKAAVVALGIKRADASSELESLLTKVPFAKMETRHWKTLWRLVTQLPTQEALAVLKRHKVGTAAIRVRTLSGLFQPMNAALLPGPIVPDDASRDASVAIDTRYHEAQMEVLAELGALSVPTRGRGSRSGKWFAEYRAHAVVRYLEALSSSQSRPMDQYLDFRGEMSVGPLDPIYRLSDEGKAKFTEQLLLAAVGLSDLTMVHTSRSDYYPAIPMEPPPLWLARTHGLLATSRGLRSVDACVGKGLQQWKDVLPVAFCPEEAARIAGLPPNEDALTQCHWLEALAAAESMPADWPFGTFYATAARRIEAPPTIACKVGDTVKSCPTRTVTVAVTNDEAQALVGQPLVTVHTKEQAELLIERWGLLPAKISVAIHVDAVPSGPPTTVSDMFPLLGLRLDDTQRSAEIVRCSALRLDIFTTTGKKSIEKTLLAHDDKIYISERLPDEDLLDHLTAHFELQISPAERQSILDNRVIQKVKECRATVRNKPTLAEKLLEAVGAGSVRSGLPAGLAAAAQDRFHPFSDERAAELALAVYGVDTLQTFKADLDGNGLAPPPQWAGTHAARKFVEGLGFPKEYAGFPQARRDPVLEVEGPPNLPPLHPFQKTITQRIRQLLIENSPRRRGLLSLPTGAGKTRVTVQALIDAVRDDELAGPILWIAQSDELCEQAVQTWNDVWRAFGRQRRLVINRLWAANEADSADDAFQVVVATIQKLLGCIDDEAYKWLSLATCTVIDEAHTSTEPSYTAVLGWLGLGRTQDRCPLVGLTATPFRGGEVETGRLVGRYGRNRLDDGVLGEDPYRTLQDMEVLARVDHEELEGIQVDVDPEELTELNVFSRVPATVAERIGSDVSRNETLLASIKARPPDWHILLFATSVDHAQTMAALLTAEGVPSAAITAHTDPRVRRHYIERFRAGEIRVLSNYQVLTAGFDAPATRAVYVARPTYSPSLYQQMIGRGLRGPLNGGKQRCLIVNVKDNIRQYGEALAFTQFEYLWSVH